MNLHMMPPLQPPSCVERLVILVICSLYFYFVQAAHMFFLNSNFKQLNTPYCEDVNLM